MKNILRVSKVKARLAVLAVLLSIIAGVSLYINISKTISRSSKYKSEMVQDSIGKNTYKSEMVRDSNGNIVGISFVEN